MRRKPKHLPERDPHRSEVSKAISALGPNELFFRIRVIRDRSEFALSMHVGNPAQWWNERELAMSAPSPSLFYSKEAAPHLH